jgi:hypothetical protein
MNAVGFIPVEPEHPDLEKLREACQRLNFTIKSITDAHKAMSHLNVGQAQDGLNNALWQVRQAKKMVCAVGKKRIETEAKSKKMFVGYAA